MHNTDIEKYVHWLFSNPKSAAFYALGITAFILLFLMLLRRPFSFSSAFNKIKLPKGKLDMSHNNLNNHALILAASSAGKTKSLIHPLIVQMLQEKTTGCLYDFKFPDVASFTYSISLTDESNIKNWYVNFHDPSRSYRINPFSNIESTAEASELALTLISNLNPGQRQNDFWIKSGTAILSSIIYFLSRYENGKYSTLPHVIEFVVGKQPKEIIDIISIDGEAAKLLAPVATGRDAMEQLSGQVSTIQADLSRYVNEKVYWVLSTDTDGFKGFAFNEKENPSRLIVGNDPENPSYASPLVGLLFSTAFRKMMKQERMKSQFLIDEAGTYRIADLESRIVTCRSYGISVCMALQDFGQLETQYGTKQAQAIRGSCNTKVFGRLSEGTDYIQKHFGTYTIRKKSTSQNHNGANSTSGISYSDHEEPRVKSEYMSQLMPGEFIFDSNAKRFKQKVNLKEHDRYGLPELTFVTEQMLKENYQRIEREVRSIQ